MASATETQALRAMRDARDEQGLTEPADIKAAASMKLQLNGTAKDAADRLAAAVWDRHFAVTEPN